MIFTETPLKGAYLLDLDRREDDRGFFARTWCEQEATALGLNPHIAQCNVSFNRRKGGVRGMHFQLPPHAEARLVRCTMGVIHDVIIDLRPDSPTFLQSWSVVLSSENRRAVYLPEGFAHGFQSLEENTETFYQMSAAYAPEANVGVRWDDPAFAIQWPLPATEISQRDRSFSNFESPGPFRRR